MALKDRIALGVALPHRSPEPIDVAAVRQVAQRAEALGFDDLWVTENTLDHVFCFDPVAVLSYAAAVTTRIRLGASVVVLPIHHPALVAHQWACLDYLSDGRAILGVGLGREHHYAQFQIPREARVRRFREDVELIRALWTQPRVVPHPDSAPIHPFGILVIGERKVVLGVEPAMIGPAQARKGSAFDHRAISELPGSSPGQDP